VSAGTIELVSDAAATGNGQEQRFTGAVDLRAVTGGPVEVGGEQAQASDAPERADGGRSTSEVERRCEPVGRDDAGDSQGPVDVLLVDHPVDQSDPAAESGREPARLPAAFEELQ